MQRINRKIAVLLILLGCLSFLIYKNITTDVAAKEFNEVKIEEIMKKIEAKEAVLIYYSAKDCLACQIFHPVLKEVAKKLKIPIYQLDAANKDNSSFVKEYNLIVTPTLLLFKEGEVTRQEGAIEKSDLEKQLRDWKE